ncbi:MAG: dTDP-4-dehydrorhamnose reductase [Chloroflexi bacterium]|nr:dTDP-4-dehydrorhamnose reductase [Chloroflexota bacterium]
MRTLLTGANGQLASDLLKLLPSQDTIALAHGDLDVCDDAAVRKALERYRPDVVINTSAFHKVDLCEDEVARPFEVNALAVRHLALLAREMGFALVHFSTDYVFSGDKRRPYHEDDAPGPLSVYGVSKLAGEYFVRTLCPHYFLVRTSGLYGVAGSSGKGGNFVETMLRLAQQGSPIRVVNDQALSPTYTHDLAGKVIELVETGRYGLYHVTNSDSCSWYTFTRTIFSFAHLKAEVQPITSEQFGAKARRPAYSVLANRNMKRLGLSPLRPWRQALQDYIQAKHPELCNAPAPS